MSLLEISWKLSHPGGRRTSPQKLRPLGGQLSLDWTSGLGVQREVQSLWRLKCMQSGVQALRAPGAGMASWWRAFPQAARRYPWPTNVLLYAGLFSAGDALQQRLRGGPADWRQTRRVATLAVTFHGNFNYVWLRLLERALPGRAPRTVLAKVLCDQTVGGPIALSDRKSVV